MDRAFIFLMGVLLTLALLYIGYQMNGNKNTVAPSIIQPAQNSTQCPQNCVQNEQPSSQVVERRSSSNIAVPAENYVYEQEADLPWISTDSYYSYAPYAFLFENFGRHHRRFRHLEFLQPFRPFFTLDSLLPDVVYSLFSSVYPGYDLGDVFPYGDYIDTEDYSSYIPWIGPQDNYFIYNSLPSFPSFPLFTNTRNLDRFEGGRRFDRDNERTRRGAQPINPSNSGTSAPAKKNAAPVNPANKAVKPSTPVDAHKAVKEKTTIPPITVLKPTAPAVVPHKAVPVIPRPTPAPHMAPHLAPAEHMHAPHGEEHPQHGKHEK